MPDQKTFQVYFEKLAPKRDKWKRRNRFYHKIIEKHFAFIIPEGSRVLELGCGTGDLLNAVKPSVGVGVDFSEEMLKMARKKYLHLKFVLANATYFTSDEKFDYIILSDLLTSLWDIQAVLKNLNKFCHPGTKLVISTYNYMWEPVLRFFEWIGLKAKQPFQNWLTVNDIKNLLELEDFELIRVERKLLFPKYIPVFNMIINGFLANLPGINQLNLLHFITARPRIYQKNNHSVSIVVPARNEKGNIEKAVKLIPKMGKHTEIIFVEGHSSDGTLEEIKRVYNKYADKRDIKYFIQSGTGKGDAVRKGFHEAKGDILMIFDADLTVPPIDLIKFYYNTLENIYI